MMQLLIVKDLRVVKVIVYTIANPTTNCAVKECLKD